ncbi:WD40-repeat-containing domain protein [Globomyces pollinis-pini]|nr:WD40-repeat-containing domain protein [Globomyces pollinis-pini]
MASHQNRLNHPPPQYQMQQQLPIQSPKHLPGNRIIELMDSLKHEIDMLNEDSTLSKHHRKDLELKLTAQINEVAAMKQSLFELERVYSNSKIQYEEEIIRLRRELESRGIPLPTANTSLDARNYRKQSILPDGIPPPNLNNNPRNPNTQNPPFNNSQPPYPPNPNAHPSYQDKAGSERHPKQMKLQDNSGQMVGGPPPHLQQRHRDSIPNLKPVQGVPPMQKPRNAEEYRQHEFRQSHYNGHVPPHMQSGPPGAPPAHPQQGHPPAQPHPQHAPPPQPKIDQRAGAPPHPNNGHPPHLMHGAPPNAHMPYPPPQTATPPVGQYPPGHGPTAVTASSETWKQEDLTLALHARLQKANVSVDLLHSFEHSSVVCCVKFSPDGKYLATGCNHFAQIYEISSGRKILALVDETISKDDDLYIRFVCFSPDGVYLATGAEDSVIRIWDIVNGRIKLKLQGHSQDIYSLDWSRDGKLVISGSGDGTVKVWDAENGNLLRTLTSDSVDPDKQGKDSGVTSVAIGPKDSRCVIAGSLDDIIRVWDVKTGHLLERFEGHGNSVYSVAFSPDGRSIVSGSLDQTIRIWDFSPSTLQTLMTAPGPRPEVAVTKQCRRSFAGHQDYVLSVGYPGLTSSIGRVDPQGRPIHDTSFDIEWVVSGGKDRHVLFWDVKDTSEKATPLIQMSGHKNSVISVAVGPIGGVFATGSGDQKARIWRVSRMPVSTPPVPQQQHQGPPQAVHQPPTSQHQPPSAQHQPPNPQHQLPNPPPHQPPNQLHQQPPIPQHQQPPNPQHQQPPNSQHQLPPHPSQAQQSTHHHSLPPQPQQGHAPQGSNQPSGAPPSPWDRRTSLAKEGTPSSSPKVPVINGSPGTHTLPPVLSLPKSSPITGSPISTPATTSNPTSSGAPSSNQPSGPNTSGGAAALSSSTPATSSPLAAPARLPPAESKVAVKEDMDTPMPPATEPLVKAESGEMETN